MDACKAVHARIFSCTLKSETLLLLVQRNLRNSFLSAALSSFTNESIQLSSQQPFQMTAPRQQRSVSLEMNIPPAAPPAVVDQTSVLSTTLATPHSSFMIQFPWNLQNGIELRAPAPHLRASPSMQAAHVSTTWSGTPNQSPRNLLATSVKLTGNLKAAPEV